MATVIKCIVADKKAVDLLRLIKEYCLEPPVVEPLDSGNEVKPKGNLTQAVNELVENTAKQGGKVIQIATLREMARTMTGNPNSYSYALKMLLKAKRLKRGKLPKTYEVIR